MERAAVLVLGDVINAADLGFIDETLVTTGEAMAWPDEDLPSAIARLEDVLIRRALMRTAGNRAEAARTLGIHQLFGYNLPTGRRSRPVRGNSMVWEKPGLD
jgi:DNA-binding NtrC family response regulator